MTQDDAVVHAGKIGAGIAVGGKLVDGTPYERAIVQGKALVGGNIAKCDRHTTHPTVNNYVFLQRRFRRITQTNNLQEWAMAKKVVTNQAVMNYCDSTYSVEGE
eukprot:2502300-Amphidinium_carterae.1